VPDPEGAPREAELEALASGVVDLTFAGEDQFSDEVSIVAPVTVLAASRIDIQLGEHTNCTGGTVNGVHILRPLDNELTGSVAALGVPLDSREEAGQPDYSGSLSSILWSSDNGTVLFDAGGGPNPTASGTLTLDLVLNAAGADVIRCTALNAVGASIAGAVNVYVKATTSVSLVVAPK
jgi:hypothetical protein